MEINISMTNSKLGSQIPSVSLPPQMSCREDAPCARLCYGKRGNFLFRNVQESHRHNYERYMADSDAYFGDVISFLNDALVSYKYFRWHAVGDIVDDAYFLGMVKVAKACPNVKFLCFTKKFGIVNGYLGRGGRIPKNLRIVFSAWSKSFRVDNPYRLPVAYVLFRKGELNPAIPDLAIPCGGHCPECLACWSLEKGQSVYFRQH